MKLSFMTFACPQWTLAEVLRGATRYGYRGVEPRVLAGHKHGIEPDMPAAERARVRQAFADGGLANCCVATSCRFAETDPAKRRANVDALKRHVELAADVGAPRIRVFGGVRPQGMTAEDGIRIVAEDLRAGADLAAEMGVTICLETHDDFARGETVAAVLARADHPALRANWDVMHPHTHGEAAEATWAALRGKVEHVHCHDTKQVDGRWPTLMPGAGELPLGTFLGWLAEAGFAGYLSAEYWTELGPPEKTLPEYVGRMREILDHAQA